MDENLAEFLGIHYADGSMGISTRESVGTEYSIYWYGDPKKEAGYHQDFVRPLWKKVFGISVTPRLLCNKTIAIREFSKGIVQFLSKTMRVPLNKKSDRIFIPEYVKESTPPIQKAFLRGFIDGDFCVEANSNKYACFAIWLQNAWLRIWPTYCRNWA